MEIQSVEEISANIHRIEAECESSDSMKLLNVSDVHFDSLKCDRQLLKRHFDKAVEEDALIFINGDWFDVMGCKKDPRSLPNQVRSQYFQEGKSYLDLVVRDSIDFLGDYKDNILLMGYGNHETKIKKHKETDPLENLVYYLNEVGNGSDVMVGGYSGVISFTFSRYGGSNFNKTVQYHHGHGGSAHRSKGMLDVDLDAAKWPDADLITKGHDHNRWQTEKIQRRFSSRNNKRYENTQHHIRTGSYKKLGKGEQGWSVEKGHEPKPRGGFWIEFEMRNRNIDINITPA